MECDHGDYETETGWRCTIDPKKDGTAECSQCGTRFVPEAEALADAEARILARYRAHDPERSAQWLLGAWAALEEVRALAQEKK